MISLFLFLIAPVSVHAEGKGIGTFNVLDGIAAVSHSKKYNTYIEPVIFNSPNSGLVWGLGISHKI
jgi:hypothetical protein